MAYNKDNGQQLACKVVDLRAMRDRATKEIEEQKSKFFRNKWQASMVNNNNNKRADVIAVHGLENYLMKKVQEKLAIYHREAKVLENLSHVSSPWVILNTRILTIVAQHHQRGEGYKV